METQAAPPRIRVGASEATAAPVSLLENIGGKAPKQKTEVRIWKTADDLHLLFEVEDDHIVATMRKRDDPLYEEEVVEMFLDPVGDLQSYFELEVNPLGTICDLILRRTASGWRKDFKWDFEGIQTRVTKTKTGWTCEIIIPIASITNEPPKPGTVWRVNFLRIDRPKGMPRELSAWSPTLAETFHVANRFGFLEFVE